MLFQTNVNQDYSASEYVKKNRFSARIPYHGDTLAKIKYCQINVFDVSMLLDTQSMCAQDN